MAGGRGDDPETNPAALKDRLLFRPNRAAEAALCRSWVGLQVETCPGIPKMQASQLPASLGFQPSLHPVTPQLHPHYPLPGGIRRGIDG